MDNYVFNQKEYRQSIKKKTSFFFPIVIIVIIILIGLVLFFNSNNRNEIKYYFVKIDSFSTYSDANKLATQLQEQNAGGYIHFDEKYHVLASYYSSQDQAKNVVERLKEKYNNADIYTLTFSEFNGKNQLTKSQNSTIFDLNDCIESIITNLSELLIKYERNEISNTILTAKIKALTEDFNDNKDNFFSSINQPKFHNERNCIEKISTSLNAIKSSFDAQNLTQTIRYETIQIIFNYSKFCALF